MRSGVCKRLALIPVLLGACVHTGTSIVMEASCDVTSEGTCPADCQEIRARPVVLKADEPCLGESELLGCYPAAANATNEDACIATEDGSRAFELGGSDWVGLLDRGYRQCTDVEQMQSTRAVELTECSK